MYKILLALLITTSTFAQDAWIIVNGTKENPFWTSYVNGIKSACKHHNISCNIQFTQTGQYIEHARMLHKAMNSSPLAIAINVPDDKQVTTLLRQADSYSYPVVLSVSGANYFRKLKLSNYVGPNLNRLRTMIRESLTAKDLQHVMISSYSIPDNDHFGFTNSLIDATKQTQLIHPKDIKQKLTENDSAPLSLITFGDSSARETYDILKEHPQWNVKWIQIDGPSFTKALTHRQISTQPFAQGYRTVISMIKTTQDDKSTTQEILVKPKST